MEGERNKRGRKLLPPDSREWFNYYRQALNLALWFLTASAEEETLDNRVLIMWLFKNRKNSSIGAIHYYQNWKNMMLMLPSYCSVCRRLRRWWWVDLRPLQTFLVFSADHKASKFSVHVLPEEIGPLCFLLLIWLRQGYCQGTAFPRIGGLWLHQSFPMASIYNPLVLLKKLATIDPHLHL